MKTTLKVVFFYTVLTSYIAFGKTQWEPGEQSIRPMSPQERNEIKELLVTVSKASMDECFINISNFSNKNILEHSKGISVTYTEKKSRHKYTRTQVLTTMLQINNTVSIPESNISFDSPSQFRVTYIAPITLDLVDDVTAFEINPLVIEMAYVQHTFEVREGQVFWKNARADIKANHVIRPHIRCQLQSNGFSSLTSSSSFKFMDLELGANSQCLIDCAERNSKIAIK